EPASAPWPTAPSGDRYQAVREAADLVRTALAAPSAPVAGPDPPEPDPAGADPSRPNRGDGPDERDQILVAAWERDTTLLLAERDRRRGDGARPVELPEQLSVSALVTLARDPAE